jgi:exopolyphosphatase/guanosine-5'-triphosphate,3'-diphosphate pyrophosphatase
MGEKHTYASIDIGSNTVRLLIWRLTGERTEEIIRDQRITRLASDLVKSGHLLRDRIEETIRVLVEYSEIMRANDVGNYIAFGTGALREATNSGDFIARAEDSAGLRIRVLSGEEEADLIARGVINSLGESGGTCLIVDIGGGSTEVILSSRGRVVYKRSLPVGVVKLCESYLFSDPPSSGELERMERELESVVDLLDKDLRSVSSEMETTLVGTAGTITTLASVDLELRVYQREKVHLHRLSRARLEDIFDHLKNLPLSEREKVKGLEKGRADIIIPGAAFYIKIMERFGYENVTVSDSGLLEGAMMSLTSSTPL